MLFTGKDVPGYREICFPLTGKFKTVCCNRETHFPVSREILNFPWFQNFSVFPRSVTVVPNTIFFWWELLVRVWFVLIMMVLVVACLFGCVSSPILSEDHFYISFCTYHLPKRHMMGRHVWISPAFVIIIILARTRKTLLCFYKLK